MAGEQSLVVQARPFVASLGVVGTVTPGDSLAVVAPFDGIVKRVGFEYGRDVVAGQVLLVMDPSDLEQRRREAESAFLKADQAERDMANWAEGPDVARAKRAETAAEMELKATQRKMTETKALLDRGLVARVEYDGLQQQQQSQTLALTAAQDDLATVLKRGEGDSRRIPGIEFENAKARLAQIDAELAGTIVKAPIAGVIVRPPADKTEGGGAAVHAGQKLTLGQLVGSIARAGGVAVAFKLDEADAARVREGQPVTVTGPGFGGVTAQGQVASVAGEATAGEAGGPGGGATFAAVARLDGLSAEQVRAIRIGMSANVEITLYQAPSAIVVPPQAVMGAGVSAMVMLRDPHTGQERPQAVRIGATAPDGVEILSGLKTGDMIVWRPTPGMGPVI
jgi:multidrug efflux pump subunit AcrA (membrane-fusion protein)